MASFVGTALLLPLHDLTVLLCYAASLVGMAGGAGFTVGAGRWFDRCARKASNRAMQRALDSVPISSARTLVDGVARVRGRVRPLEPVGQDGEVVCVRGTVRRVRRFEVVDETGAVLIDAPHLELWFRASRASESDRPVYLRAGDRVDLVAVGRWELVLGGSREGYRQNRPVYRLLGRPGTPVHLRVLSQRLTPPASVGTGLDAVGLH